MTSINTQLSNKGFGITALLMVMVVIGVIVGAGSYIARSKNNVAKPDSGNSAISNFDECVAAGNPIQESFPERCLAHGTLYINEGTTPNLESAVIKTPTAEEVSKWKTFTAQNGKFSISVPDGWTDLKICNAVDIGFRIASAGSLDYIPGKPAKIENINDDCPISGDFGFAIFQSPKECQWHDQKQETIKIPGGWAEVFFTSSDFSPQDEIEITEYSIRGDNGLRVCMEYLRQQHYPNISSLLRPMAESFKAL